MFAFALAGAFVLPVVFFLMHVTTNGFHGWHVLWPADLWLLALPPVVAAFVVYATYPGGNRVRAFLLGAFCQVLGGVLLLVFLTVILPRVSHFLSNLFP